MELTKRRLDILAAIVELYIATGEPVGSKAVANALDLNLSSATVRNEMSRLTEMGLIEQPHTSAGRAPTPAGYRLYIDRLMKPHPLEKAQRQLIDSMLPVDSYSPEQILDMASKALAEITSYTAISTASAEDVYITKTELIPMGRRTAMFIVLTSNGILKNRIFRLDTDLTDRHMELFSNFLTRSVQGMKLGDICPGMMQTLAAGLGKDLFTLSPLISALSDMSADSSDSGLHLRGQANLLKHGEMPISQAQAIMEFLADQTAVLSILHNYNDDLNVLIGKETGIAALWPSSLVFTKYTTGGSDSGQIGIVGPIRMDYNIIIPRLQYFASRLSKLLDHLMEDVKGNEKDSGEDKSDKQDPQES